MPDWLKSLLDRLFGRPPEDVTPIPYGPPPSIAQQRQAWLDAIAYAEGTAAPDGYRYLFGSSATNNLRFDSFATHPRIARSYTDLSGRSIITTAAGRYQINYPTFTEFGGGSFTPAAQDAMALAITQRCGALPDVDAGRLQAALDKCGGRWASLPTSGAPQPHRTYAQVEAAFKRAGGVVAA